MDSLHRARLLAISRVSRMQSNLHWWIGAIVVTATMSIMKIESWAFYEKIVFNTHSLELSLAFRVSASKKNQVNIKLITVIFSGIIRS